MKGITRLQLINAKTKEIEKEVVEENYLTKVLNICHKKYSEYPSFNVGQALSIPFKDLAQGVLLFSNNKPLDGNECITTVWNDELTGYAYDLYSGTDIKRGSLNELESGDLYEGDRISGYRKVWDFGTGVAIGGINAISLTQGNVGGMDLSSIPTLTGLYSKNLKYSSNYYKKFFDVSDNYMLFNEYLGTSSNFNFDNFWIIPFYKGKVLYDRSPLAFSGDLSFNSDSSNRIIIDLTEAVPTGYTRSMSPCIDNNYFYVLYHQDAVGFKIHKYDIANNAFIEELTFNFIYTATPTRWKISSDKLVWTNGNDVYWTDRTSISENIILDCGDNIAGFNFSKKYPNSIFCMTTRCDRIYVTSSNDDTRFETYYVDLVEKKTWNRIYIQDSGDYSYLQSYTKLYQSAVYVDEPFYLTSLHVGYAASYPTYITTAIFTFMPFRFLSTINNLSSTLNKATDQILKIIYDFVW